MFKRFPYQHLHLAPVMALKILACCVLLVLSTFARAEREYQCEAPFNFLTGWSTYNASCSAVHDFYRAYIYSLPPPPAPKPKLVYEVVSNTEGPGGCNCLVRNTYYGDVRGGYRCVGRLATKCKCKDPVTGKCTPCLPPEAERSVCEAGAGVGNPIVPATGEKILSQSDYTGVGHSALSLIRSYRSSRVIADLEGYTGPANQTTVTVTEKGIGTDRRGFNPGMGQPWSHNHAHYLALTGTLGVQGSTAKLMLGDGSVRAFTFSGGEGGTFQPHNSVDTLSINPAGLAYYRQDDNSTW